MPKPPPPAAPVPPPDAPAGDAEAPADAELQGAGDMILIRQRRSDRV